MARAIARTHPPPQESQDGSRATEQNGLPKTSLRRRALTASSVALRFSRPAQDTWLEASVAAAGAYACTTSHAAAPAGSFHASLARASAIRRASSPASPSAYASATAKARRLRGSVRKGQRRRQQAQANSRSLRSFTLPLRNASIFSGSAEVSHSASVISGSRAKRASALGI